MSGTRRLIALVIGAALVVAVVVTTRVADRSDREDSGRYAGLTDQRLPVRLTASKDRRRLSLDVSWVAHCGRTQGTAQVTIKRTVRSSAATVAADGSFSWRGRFMEKGPFRSEERQRLELRGRRAADGALTGTWRAENDIRLGRRKTASRRCSTGDVKFRARPDGDVRLPAPRTDAAGNRIFALPGAPDRVAAGAGGVWVLSTTPLPAGRLSRRTLHQVDPQSGELMSRTLQEAGNSFLSSSFVAGEGAGWLAVQGSLDIAGAPRRAQMTLARLDARTRAVTTQPDERFMGALSEMSVGAGGVWLLVQSRPGRQRILRAGRDGRIEAVIALRPDRRAPRSRRCLVWENARIGAGTAGAVWVASSATWSCGRLTPQKILRLPIRARTLRRIDPRSNRVTRTIALDHAYERLTATATELWATTCVLRIGILGCEPSERPELHRLGTRDGRPTSVTRLPAGRVIGLATSRDAVWISHIGPRGRGGRLLRVDRRTGRLSTALRFEGAPSNVSVGEGGVWVLDTFARTLIRVPTVPPPPGKGPADGA